MADQAQEEARKPFPLAEFPRLRSVEIFPVSDRGHRGYVLRDPADPTINPMIVSDGATDVLMLLDGSRTLPQLSTALSLRGSAITDGQLRTFLGRLDEAGFLEGPRAMHRAAQRKARFLTLPTRPAVHAGGAYAGEPEGLRNQLAAGYLHRDGPGAPPGPRTSGTIRALVAPHVDLHRGAPTYSWAYKALAESEPAELYVILGTCHTPVDGHFSATRKAYDTPLGAVPADAYFLEGLASNWGHDLFEGELSHAGEHSIEFQAVYLRSLGLAGENAAPIVPILCDSLHSIVPPHKSPRDARQVEQFLRALEQSLRQDGRRITLIAAVDFAHIGHRFGDRWPVDATRQAMVAAADREMLELILTPDAEAYYGQVMHDRDARRICGLTPLYLLSALMQTEARRGELLRYTQWVDTDLSSSVTFGSAVFR